MKAKFLYLILILVVILYSCKKSIDIPIGISATVNYDQWRASDYGSQIDTPGHTPILYVYGGDSVKINYYPYYVERGISFDIINYANRTGYYKVGSTTCNAVYSVGSVQTYIDSGAVNLTGVSAHNVQGTFVFYGGSTFSMTNGKFNVNIQ